MIPAGKRDAVVGVLDDEGIDFALTEEVSGREYVAVASFPLPTSAVEPVLERLRAAGLERDAYTVVVDAETVVSRRYERLERRYAAENGNGPGSERIAREELAAAAEDLVAGPRAYVVMTVVSSLIATAGLLLDSPAVVVGSMVIAPLIGPAMAASVGTVLDDETLFVRGVRLQALGLALAVGSAALFALLLRFSLLIPPGTDVLAVPQVRERLAPDVLSLAVALGAGVAGVVSLSTGVSSALVGVMIAVALIPPAATVGIALAWGSPVAAAGSAVLVLVNVLSINLAALAVLWYAGYRPSRWFDADDARAALATRIAVLVVAIAVLSVFLGGVTYDSYRTAALEESAREEVRATLVGTAPEATLVSLELAGREVPTFGRPDHLVVTVGVPPGDPPTGLAPAIDRAVSAAVDREMTVEVRYVAVEDTRPDGAASGAGAGAGGGAGVGTGTGAGTGAGVAGAGSGEGGAGAVRDDPGVMRGGAGGSHHGSGGVVDVVSAAGWDKPPFALSAG
jgi:uncharacterized hydrophobic protein (TIGR00341 family)